MKKIIIVTLTAITVLFFTGCGIFNSPGITDPPDEQIPEEHTTEPETPESENPNYEIIPEYEIIEDTYSLPPEIVEIIEHLKRYRGYFVFSPQDYATGDGVYVLISAGEKPTGGYFIEVDSLSVKNGILEMVIAEKEPAEEDGVIQVITYPLVVVKVFDLYNNFNVINDKNMKFEEISTENIPLISKESGIYIGQIDNNFIEIEVVGETKAFMLADQELIQHVNEGDEILFKYFKDEYNRLVVMSIEKAP